MKRIFALTILCLFASQSFAQTDNNQNRQEKQARKSALSDSDQLQIAVQMICPVSGEELGSMGEPIKIKAGQQIAYLCCKGCQGKQINAEHWKTIQFRMAKAQGTCPIMGKEVDSTMKSTVVNGQQIFVCCPPCIKKIQEDPQTALKKVNANYASFVKTAVEQRRNDLHIAAQQICPVSGQKLGSMGPPIKVQVGQEYAFLCCKACTGKQISGEHWKTVQANLAKAQGICPVMEKPVDASMKSTVVNGRKIFVCCPPCIDKINADPDTYLAKLDAQYVKSIQSRGAIKSDKLRR